MSNAAERTREILRDEKAPAQELKNLAKELKGDLEFGLARRLLAEVREKNPHDVEISQQLALCTYKDEELLPASRFATALSLLEEIGLRDPQNTNPETLALGGAVYKRMWEYGGQIEYLYEALAFYRAAAERNPQEDKGYGGINAAYILDLLAARTRAVAQRSGTASIEAAQFDQQARDLRARMAREVPRLVEKDPSLNNQYWFVVTRAEIFFGLGDYEKAKEDLSRVPELEAKEWEKQTTFRQLVSIARFQGCELPKERTDPASWHPAWQALAGMLGDDTERALSCYRGKVGLALSGGGFRASLFHLGVLARLAEMDVLRSVEVLSTVSGGSIVGAHYYLEVRHLLQSKKDQDITREDYIELVRRVQKAFLEGIQKNLRMRVLSSFAKNFQMIFSSQYTRSHRLGELYEEELYAKVPDRHPAGQPRCLRDLLIKPAEETNGETFKPKFSNWRRRTKVPVLLLNATSLNSGHNWHFTARSMGEPPGLVGGEVDKNVRYRRLYYEQAPTEELKNYRLGYAVAASACVPALFEPLVIEGLYQDRVVRLVDGGVHDNQGMAGLLDEGCTLILCSDASGQLEDKNSPSDSVLGVPLRSNSILMDRVRKTEYQDLCGRVDSRALQGLFFIHLKKDLLVLPVDWVHCDDPTPTPQNPPTTTPYGVDIEVQGRLAVIRTDLDSFSEVEAYSLMLSGYLMTKCEFKKLQEEYEKSGEPGTWGGFTIDAPREDWPFLQLESLLSQPKESRDPKRQDLGQQLAVASGLFFKVWHLDEKLRLVSKVGAVVGALLVLWLIIKSFNTPLIASPITVGQLLVLLVVAIAGFAWPMLKWLWPEEATRSMIYKAALGVAGFLVSQLHLLIFDKRFLERGKLQRLLTLRR